jgi:hypothetical protein
VTIGEHTRLSHDAIATRNWSASRNHALSRVGACPIPFCHRGTEKQRVGLFPSRGFPPRSSFRPLDRFGLCCGFTTRCCPVDNERCAMPVGWAAKQTPASVEDVQDFAGDGARRPTIAGAGVQ